MSLIPMLNAFSNDTVEVPSVISGLKLFEMRMISFVDLDHWIHQKQHHKNIQPIRMPSDTTTLQLPIWIQHKCDCIKREQVARPRIKRIREALNWLKGNNPLYSVVTIDEAAFREIEVKSNETDLMMPSSIVSKKQMMALLTAKSHRELLERVTELTGVAQLDFYEVGLLPCTPVELTCLTALEIRMIALFDPEHLDYHLKDRANYPSTLRRNELVSLYSIWSIQPKQMSLPELRKREAREARSYEGKHERSPVPRTENLKRALCWLKQNNSLYNEVTEAGWTLQLLEDQERTYAKRQPPPPITHLRFTAAQILPILLATDTTMLYKTIAQILEIQLPPEHISAYAPDWQPVSYGDCLSEDEDQDFYNSYDCDDDYSSYNTD